MKLFPFPSTVAEFRSFQPTLSICPGFCPLGFPFRTIRKQSQEQVVLRNCISCFAVMIPERWLEHLVEQALDMQRDACVFHNTLNSELSLYSDHQCGRNQIPSQTLQILREHKDEVWFLLFSHKKYLASSSKYQSAVIWKVKEDSQVILKHTLSGHQRPVLTISWSFDDSQLLTCGMEEAIRRWDVNSGECLRVSCGWLADGEGMVSGMTDKSTCLWDLDGKEVVLETAAYSQCIRQQLLMTGKESKLYVEKMQYFFLIGILNVRDLLKKNKQLLHYRYQRTASSYWLIL